MEVDGLEAARSAMKVAFESAIETLDTGSKRARDLLTSVSAWLATTLVALDASLIPLILSYSDRNSYPRLVLLFAVCGLVSSIIAAIWLVLHLNSAINAYTEVKGNIKAVDTDGDLTEMVKVDTGLTDRIGTETESVAVAMIAPLFFFVASTATFGLGFKFKDVSNVRRCAAIQQDMLAARPRRDDSAELFQALGCRPQGDGDVFAPPQRPANSKRITSATGKAPTLRTPALPHQDRTRGDRTPVAAPAAPAVRRLVCPNRSAAHRLWRQEIKA